jgi:hypothetical protein
VEVDPPSSILGGEELLARIYTAVRASSTAGGSNFANTLFLWGAPRLPDSPSIRMVVWKGEVIASTEEELLS